MFPHPFAPIRAPFTFYTQFAFPTNLFNDQDSADAAHYSHQTAHPTSFTQGGRSIGGVKADILCGALYPKPYPVKLRKIKKFGSFWER